MGGSLLDDFVGGSSGWTGEAGPVSGLSGSFLWMHADI